MKKNIEQRLTIALSKKSTIRDRMVLKILDLSIQKCVQVLLKKNKKYIRLYSADDLIQEANITILDVLRNNNFNSVKCEIRTYLLGAVKRRLWSIIRKECAIKRRAQERAYPLEFLKDQKRYFNSSGIKIGKEGLDILKKLETENIIEKITEKLEGVTRNIFIDLISGYSMKNISKKHNIPLSYVYTLLTRKIRPIAKQLISIE